MESVMSDREAVDCLLTRSKEMAAEDGAGPTLTESDAPGGAAAADSRRSRMDLLRAVHLRVRVELGRASLALKDVLALAPGSIIDLDKLAHDPVDIYVGEVLLARGEVVTDNDALCVRITEVLAAGQLGGEGL